MKKRGLLDETLIIWAGEFGRTVYSQGELTADDYGRDHHPRAFTIWMAGGGIRPGITLGETDDYGYNITQDPVHIHDLNATILRCLGIVRQTEDPLSDRARLLRQRVGEYFFAGADLSEAR